MAVGSIVAAGISAGVTIYQASEAQKAADYNAGLIEKDAEFARFQSTETALDLAEQGEGFKASQKSAFASSGIKTSEGSPLQLLKETQDKLELDVQNIRDSGDLAKLSGDNQADELKRQGQAGKTAGIISAGTSFATSLIGTGLQQKWWGE